MDAFLFAFETAHGRALTAAPKLIHNQHFWVIFLPTDILTENYYPSSRAACLVGARLKSRDRYKCYKITYSFFDPTVLGSIPQHHDPKMWEALGRPPDMDEIKVAIRQLKEFREGP